MTPFDQKGIDDTDLVIYITFTDHECQSDGSTLAWASTCNLDQYGRPIAGTINFCPSSLGTMFWKFDVSVVLHEMLHILIMSNGLFPYFWHHDVNQFYSEEEVLAKSSATGLDNDYVVTEIVQSVESFLRCDDVICFDGQMSVS